MDAAQQARAPRRRMRLSRPLPAAWRRAFPAMPDDMSWAMLVFDILFPLPFLWASITETPQPWNPFFGELDGPLPRIAWSMLLAVPCLLRRLDPDAMVWSFVTIVAAQLAFGPALLEIDVLAAPMLYTALVYGSRSQSRDFIVAGIVMTFVSSAFISYSSTVVEMTIMARLDGSPVPYPSIAVLTCTQRDEFVSAFIENVVTVGICVALAIMTGLWRRTTRESVALLRERNAILERTQQDAQREAAIRERARIARDMHDVVAHTLSTIIVQADAGRYVGAHDPAMARSTMETIQRETTHAQHDMDQLLGVLTVGTDSQGSEGMQGDATAQGNAARGQSPRSASTRGTATRMQPTLQGVGYDSIPDLISQACLPPSRLAVTHTVLGRPRPGELSANGSICAYRVVQEALTNARKYAAGSLLAADQNGERKNVEQSSASDGAQNGIPRTVHVSVEESWVADAPTGNANSRPTVGSLGPANNSQAPANSRESVTAGSTESAEPVRAGLRLVITDDGVGAGSGSDGHKPGFGLMGMRERVSAAGGTLKAGPRSTLEAAGTPGFRVEAFIPFESADLRQSNTMPGIPVTDINASIGEESTDAAASAPGVSPAAASRSGVPIALAAPGAVQTSRRKRRLHKPSIIERMAHWAMRHTMAVDTLEMLPVALVKLGSITGSVNATQTDYGMEIRLWGMPSGSLATAVAIALAILPALPLCLRRTKPDLSCMLVFAACMVELTFIGGEPLADLLPVSLSLYSGALYGTAARTRRLVACSAIGSAWLGVNLWAAMISNTFGTGEDATQMLSPFGLLISGGANPWGSGALQPETSWHQVLFICVIGAVLSFLICLIFIATGSRARSSNDNYVLLKAREEALTRERDAREQAAAAEERTRISARIQREVSETLAHIAVMAQDGRRQLDGDPTPQQVSESFHAIAAEGRRALRRMRELLGVLRGTSGDASAIHAAADTASLPQRELRPAAPLPQQLHDSGLSK